jgi:dienelactone hydrolase
MATILRIFLVCLIVLLIPIEGFSADKAQQQKRLSKHYKLKKPEGTGPFPTVMMIPGCSGFDAKFTKKHYDVVQKRLVKLGFVTLRVNYHAVRNASDCYQRASGEQKIISAEEVAGDIVIAIDYLRNRPFVKKEAINVLCWDWGGSGALVALGRTLNRDPIQVATVVAYYPDCRTVTQKWESKVPVLILAGALDVCGSLRFCRGLFVGLPVTAREYENAHLGFDIAELLNVGRTTWGCIYGYNESAAKSAWEEVIKFLRK